MDAPGPEAIRQPHDPAPDQSLPMLVGLVLVADVAEGHGRLNRKSPAGKLSPQQVASLRGRRAMARARSSERARFEDRLQELADLSFGGNK